MTTSLESWRDRSHRDLDDPATDPFDVADAAAAVIAERTGVDHHDVALVLGSGWGQTADLIGETLATVDNADVPGFHAAAVAGHRGSMRSVAIGDTGRRALVFGTRTHFYEGRGVRAVVHGVRTAAAAGCSTIVLTNGCGGLNPAWAPGHAGADQRPHQPHRRLPHRGRRTSSTSPTSTPPRLRALAREVDPTLDEGVYVQFRGPHYETPAEVQMAKRHRRRPRRHVDGARGDRGPPGGPGGARHLAGHQPGRRHLRPAAQPRGGPRGRPGRRRTLRRLLADVVRRL